jgi:prepilin-type N-terminal cleavage/methylation domain-containing protein
VKTKNHQAFSLIEISVVIIVVGILLAGISSGIELYDDYKFKVAQNLTKNSRVARIKNLELWFETTLENSFALGTTSFVDKITPIELDRIGRWNDANPNILPIARNNATQATLANQPLYYSKAINGLPALKFDGSNDGLFFNGNFLVGADYTIFVVEKRNSGKSNNCFLSGSSAVNYSRLVLCYRSSTVLTQIHWSSDLDKSIPAFNAPINTMHSFVFSKSDGRAIYTNGGTKTVNTSQKLPLIAYENSSIGAGGSIYYDGYISEIIFYTRALTDKERQEVETYLSKKWGIKLG